MASELLITFLQADQATSSFLAVQEAMQDCPSFKMSNEFARFVWCMQAKDLHRDGGCQNAELMAHVNKTEVEGMPSTEVKAARREFIDGVMREANNQDPDDEACVEAVRFEANRFQKQFDTQADEELGADLKEWDQLVNFSERLSDGLHFVAQRDLDLCAKARSKFSKKKSDCVVFRNLGSGGIGQKLKDANANLCLSLTEDAPMFSKLEEAETLMTSVVPLNPLMIVVRSDSTTMPEGDVREQLAALSASIEVNASVRFKAEVAARLNQMKQRMADDCQSFSRHMCSILDISFRAILSSLADASAAANTESSERLGHLVEERSIMLSEAAEQVPTAKIFDASRFFTSALCTDMWSSIEKSRARLHELQKHLSLLIHMWAGSVPITMRNELQRDAVAFISSQVAPIGDPSANFVLRMMEKVNTLAN